MKVELGQKNLITFNSTYRSYKNPVQGMKDINNITALCRDHVPIKQIADYTKNTLLPKNNKVNIISLAGSDGSEAYSIAIALLETIPKELQKKVLPIYSTDIDKEIVRAAKSGRINLSEEDLARLQHKLQPKIDYFINPRMPIYIKNDEACYFYKSYEPIPILKDSVKFEQCDMMNILDSYQDKGNSILVCADVFPYLPELQTKEIAYLANRNLKPDSCFVIGRYDRYSKIRNYLYSSDFEEIFPNMFKKVDHKKIFNV